MNDLIVNEEQIVEEINILQNGIISKAKACVRDAQRIGQLLAEVKKNLETCHSGSFPEWLNKNCNIPERTAYRYIDLFKYRFKINDNSNLHTAYKEIEEIKQLEQKTENQKAMERVQIAYETGTKPEGWRQHTDDKLLQQKKESEQQKKEQYKEVQKRVHDIFEEKEKEQKQTSKQWWNEYNQMKEESENIARQAEAAQKTEKEWRENIRLSANAGTIENTIISYLSTLENDSRKIECCYNIIKICKKIAKDLQVVNR